MPSSLPEDNPFRAAVLPETQVLLAGQDLLTGLSSRAGLESHFRLAAARARRSGARLAVGVAAVGVDPAAPVDEVFGHDLAVVEAAKRLRAALRETDLIARLGETRFGFIAEEVTSPGVEAIQVRVLRALKEAAPPSTGSPGPQVGLALWEGGEASLPGLLRAAEHALTAEPIGAGERSTAANAESFGPATDGAADPPRSLARRIARRVLGWLSLATLIILALTGFPGEQRVGWLPIERVAQQGWNDLRTHLPRLSAAERRP